MKKLKVVLSFVFVALLTVSSLAAAIVSPALNVLAGKNRMIKSGLRYSDVYFSEQDFKKCLGVTEIDSVTVTAVPDLSTGMLKLGTLNVTVGQTVNRNYLSALRFVPTADFVSEAEMIFTCDGVEIPCTVKYTERVNAAPEFATEPAKVSTYRNVSCYGSLRMSDPEGDAVNLQVISYPTHGRLTLTDAACGTYRYTPANGYVGKDSFTVVSMDSYGNYSPAMSVDVYVEKTDIAFQDVSGHWCENAAIRLVESGICEAARYQNGLTFSPNDEVSREEFVAMVMKTVGVETLTDAETSFDDNAQIDVRYRPYVATAQRMGYIHGKSEDGANYFAPKDCITKAEAAVVLQNILGYSEGMFVSTFADDGAIPTWAKGAVYALTAAGVFNGNGEGEIAPSAVLDRAQTVQILYNLLQK